MPKLASLQDLTRLRETVRETARLRTVTGTIIFVGAGTCGIAAGARETLRAIQQEIQQRNIDAHVTTVGCIGVCAKEPLVDIQQAGSPHVLYANIMPEMVPRLIDEHIVKGQPIKEWIICRMPAE